MISTSSRRCPAAPASRTAFVVTLLALTAASACTDAVSRAAIATQPAATTRITREDSAALGYYALAAARARLRPTATAKDAIGSTTATIVSVTPGWFIGSGQDGPITAVVSGPVNSVTVVGSGAILCSGSYGDLIAYDRYGTVVASTPLTLIYPPDCGDDLVTFGAQATVRTTDGVIASFRITPMSPITFPVYGVPGGHATQTYTPTLGVATDEPPVPKYSFSCVELTCTFNGTSSTDDKGIVLYEWDLGKSPDGTATGPIATVTYPHSGPRNVTLSVTDAAGQKRSLVQTLYIVSPPLDLNLRVYCNYLDCTFNGSSDSRIDSRSWNFGDGTTAGNLVSTTHSYATPGTYTVTETFTIFGIPSFASVSQPFTVTAPPAPDAPPTALFYWSCDGSQRCTFDGSPSTWVGNGTLSWNLGKTPDGTATGTIVTTQYAHTGERTVTLTVTDGNGKTATMTRTIVVP